MTAANARRAAYNRGSTGTPETTIPFGKYELLERINIGGMAEILKARDTSRQDQGLIAVKRILPHLTDDRQFVTMFLDESRVLAKLQHENVIRTLEVGEVSGTPFIALEYVWGQDARMLFHRGRRNEQPTPIPLACYIINQVCSALHYAHERTDERGDLLGIVHRDVSLQNVLLSYDGAVKLTDFGIAMSAQNRARTEVGVVKGKFGYMSPEQIRGEPMDRRSDVFATGICLYELLTGERLFSGDSDYAAVEKVRSVSIEPPSRWNREIPSALEAIVMKALAKHPRDRFQTAAELRRALLAFTAESRNEGSAKELAAYMRMSFEEELRLAPTPEVLRRESKMRVGAPTGLAAFDDLDPVSALSSASAVHVASAERAEPGQASQSLPEGGPSVPPVVPRRESIPPQAPRSDVFARSETPSEPHLGLAATEPAHMPESRASALGIGLDWDEDETRTQTERLDPIDGFDPAPGAAGDDEVTRQIRVGETFSGVAVVGASGIRHAPIAAGAAPPFQGLPRAEDTPQPAREPSQRTSLPTTSVYPMPRTSYAIVVAVVFAIVAVIAGALWITREARPGEVHIATSPPDAKVRIDGELHDRSRGGAIELEPDVPHRIEVFKDGHRGWSTTLSLAPGQVLRLPLVHLVTDPASSASAEAPAQGTASEPAAPVARAPDRRAAERAAERSESRRTAARTQRRPAARRTPQSRAAQPGADRSGDAATGVLRLNSRPWSEVSIDGKRVGNTPIMGHSLSAGSHTVRLENPQFGLKKTIEVRIEPGKTVTKVVDLQ